MSETAGLNVRIGGDEFRVLRKHLRSAHRSLLLDHATSGPIGNIDIVPPDVLAAIHAANHMQPWTDHFEDMWTYAGRCDNCGEQVVIIQGGVHSGGLRHRDDKNKLTGQFCNTANGYVRVTVGGLSAVGTPRI